jgi:hypothetical protein
MESGANSNDRKCSVVFFTYSYSMISLTVGGWYSEIGISSFLKPEIPAVGKKYKEYKIGIPLPLPQSLKRTLQLRS